MKLSLEVIESKLFAASVADDIVAAINETLTDNKICVIALAGGSTPGAIYRNLAMPPRVHEVEWSRVVMLLGDERWVAADDDQSNGRMVQETLVSPIKLQVDSVQPTLLRCDTTLSTIEESAKEYESLVRSAIQKRDSSNQAISPALVKSAPQIDLVLLGMGEDGHTASIFPHSSLLAESNLTRSIGDIDAALFDASVRPDDQTSRLTLTPTGIINAKRVMFIVTGENKSVTAKKVIEGVGPLSELPSRIFRQCLGEVVWYLDSSAASRLQRSTL